MGPVILRRLLSLLPLLLFVSIALFGLSLQLNPDKAAAARAGGVNASSIDQIERIKEEMGLNDPIYVRYGRWIGNAVQLDLGESLVKTKPFELDNGDIVIRGRSVTHEIVVALPRTLSIAAVGLVFGIVLGVSVGLIGGLRPGSITDRVSVLFTTLGIAVPSYWLIMLLIIFFSIDHNWLPATGYERLSSGWWPWLSHVLLPGIAVGTAVAAITARQLRASLMDVMGAAYIRTAWAKGNSSRQVITRHALKNSLSAPLTTFGTMFAHMIGGTIVIESLIGIQGIGLLTVNAVRANDIIMLQGIVLFFVVVTVAVNLVIDLVYLYANPRVRLL